MFEVEGPRSPAEAAWALLRAPFELLAPPNEGFLAENALTRFCVARRLGQPAQTRPPLDGYRLGLAFMASSPRGQHELDYEAEEAAILKAVGETRLDLVVDDTGDPAQLGHRLATLGGMPVVHLSCHGVNNWRQRPGDQPAPILMMEDEIGEGRPTTASDLVSMLPTGDPGSSQPTRPGLLFVSACLTATGATDRGHLPPGSTHKLPSGDSQPGDRRPGDSQQGAVTTVADGDEPVAHSLATALVAAGIPAVLGWDGSVIDTAATAFAGRLYERLADKEDLAVAVGDARRALLGSDDPWIRADWHLARLWLGPSGGGPLVVGNRKRSLVPATHGTKVFLNVKQQQVPVAAPEMFVGRRLELQAALRALRAGERAGVLLHGQGRLGKSSLAARIADRSPDLAMAVVYGDYGAMGILDAVATAVADIPAARDLIEDRRPEVRQRPEAIGSVLIDLLAGPLAQTGAGRERPLLLIIDDLEQILVANPNGPHRVNPDHAPVLAAVLKAFDPDRTDSRLLLTSRFTFTLNGLESHLEVVQLRPLSDVAQHKLQRRQQDRAPAQLLTERSALADRAVAVAHGNPGLQDLIVARLVYGPQVGLDRAVAAVAGMESYLRQGDLPADADVRPFLENLALDALVDEAGLSNVALLRAATLFDLPVPEPVFDALADAVGGSATRLRGLGLLVPYRDLYDPTRLALAAEPLASGRVQPLSDAERTALAIVSVSPLFAAWDEVTGRLNRSYDLDLQLTHLALLADTPEVVAECAVGAVEAMRRGPASDAFGLGQDAIAVLDRHSWAVPLDLLRRAADAALTSGDGDAGEALQNRATQQAEAADNQNDPLGRARVIAERAERLVTRGELEQAEQLLRDAYRLFTADGLDGEAASAMGKIADIAFMRGDYDEALRIRYDIELPVYERLGETRSIAVSWGKIADIAYQRGDYDEALRIRRDITLPVYERLGETRSAAISWGKIADVHFQRGENGEAAQLHLRRIEAYKQLGNLDRLANALWGLAQTDLADKDYKSAISRMAEAFQILRQLRQPVGLASVGWPLGQLLMATGAAGSGRQVLEETLAAVVKLGWTDLAQQITEFLNAHPQAEQS